MGCSSDSEYLAKLHCLRLAFREALSSRDNAEWWARTGRAMLSELLLRCGRDDKDFGAAFDDMVEFVATGGGEGRDLVSFVAASAAGCWRYFTAGFFSFKFIVFGDVHSKKSSNFPPCL